MLQRSNRRNSVIGMHRTEQEVPGVSRTHRGGVTAKFGWRTLEPVNLALLTPKMAGLRLSFFVRVFFVASILSMILRW